MTDIWTPGPPPAPAPPITGLPPTDTWVAAEPCATDGGGGLTSIVDNITITGAPGAITSVANGQPLWSIVLNDGTSSADFRIDRYQSGVKVDSPITIARADGTVTFADPVMLSEDPVEPLQAATKEYVDNVAAADLSAYLPLAGGTMTGALTLAADPAANLQAATKHYVDGNIPAASTSLPVMDGTPSIGVATAWARGDHVHPTDTSRYAAPTIQLAM